MKRDGFTLLELLIAITIVAIVASAITATVIGVTSEAALTVSQQQQAALNSAVSSWCASQPSQTQAAQLWLANSSSQQDLLALISPYLDQSTYAQFQASSTDATLLSPPLGNAGQHITLTWGTGTVASMIESSPVVNRVSN